MIGYREIDGVDSWCIEYAIRTIRQYILEKTGKDIIGINDLRSDKELAQFNKACTVAFHHFDL